MGGLLSAMQVLGLVAAPPGRAPARGAARPARRARPAPRRAGPQPRRVRVRAAAEVTPQGTRRAVLDAEVLLGEGAPVGSTGGPARGSRAGSPRRRRAAAPPRPRRPRRNPLVALGLVEPTVHLTGHPRLRARAAEAWQARRRRDQLLTGSVAVLVAVVLLGWGALRSPLMAVEAIAVHGVPSDQQAAVLQVAAVEDGANVLDVDLDTVRARVESLPWVAAASVDRRLPSTVEIRVATRQAVVVGETSGGRWLLDPDGTVLGRATDDTDLPRVALATIPTVGTVLEDPAVQSAATVAAQMPARMGEWIVGYEVIDPDEVGVRLRIPTDSGPADLLVELGRPVDVDRKAITIASLVQETIGRGMRPAGFDVRIPDRPVVIA